MEQQKIKADNNNEQLKSLTILAKSASEDSNPKLSTKITITSTITSSFPGTEKEYITIKYESKDFYELALALLGLNNLVAEYNNKFKTIVLSQSSDKKGYTRSERDPDMLYTQIIGNKDEFTYLRTSTREEFFKIFAIAMGLTELTLSENEADRANPNIFAHTNYGFTELKTGLLCHMYLRCPRGSSFSYEAHPYSLNDLEIIVPTLWQFWNEKHSIQNPYAQSAELKNLVPFLISEIPDQKDFKNLIGLFHIKNTEENLHHTQQYLNSINAIGKDGRVIRDFTGKGIRVFYDEAALSKEIGTLTTPNEKDLQALYKHKEPSTEYQSAMNEFDSFKVFKTIDIIGNGIEFYYHPTFENAGTLTANVALLTAFSVTNNFWLGTATNLAIFGYSMCNINKAPNTVIGTAVGFALGSVAPWAISSLTFGKITPEQVSLGIASISTGSNARRLTDDFFKPEFMLKSSLIYAKHSMNNYPVISSLIKDCHKYLDEAAKIINDNADNLAIEQLAQEYNLAGMIEFCPAQCSAQHS